MYEVPNFDYFLNPVFNVFTALFKLVDRLFFGGGLESGVPTTTPAGATPADWGPALVLFKSVLSFLSVVFITIIIYCLVRLYEIQQEERRKTAAIIPLPPEAGPRNERWEAVNEHINSTNPAEWRLAILEADTMLEEMVRRMGYRGENLGERLKAVEPSDFESIQSAWEAHKVRNRIAHEGSEFFLSQREARRIVGLYEDVFKEFNFI